jgi:hypothetical protein
MEATPMIIKTIKGDEINIHISEIAEGFSVAYQDEETGEFLPMVHICSTLVAAEAKAAKAVGA